MKGKEKKMDTNDDPKIQNHEMHEENWGGGVCSESNPIIIHVYGKRRLQIAKRIVKSVKSYLYPVRLVN